MQNAVKGASRIVLAIVSVALVMGLMPGAAMARQAEEGSQLQAAPMIGSQAEIDGSTDLDDGYFFMFDGKSFSEKNFYYVNDGGAVTPNVSIYYYSDLADGETQDDDWRTILSPSKYTITYEKRGEDYSYAPTTAPLGVGTYHVIATANEGSGLTGSKYMFLYVYDKYTLDGAQVAFDASYYDDWESRYIFPVGGFVEPAVTIDGEAIPASAYTLHYEDYDTGAELGTTAPTALGDYYVYATGIEPYEGWSRDTRFQISERGAGYYDISDQDVYLTDKVYTGKAIDQVPVVYHPAGLDRLQNGTDFTYKITNNVNAGTAKVAVTGKGHFYGTATGTFKIAKAANPMRAKIASKKTLSAASAKRSAQKVASVSFAKKAVGAVTYKIASAKPIARWFAVSKKGVVTAKKGVRPGKYAVKVQVSAKGDANRIPAKQTLTCAVTVK